jgi:hypothetical protein
MARMIFPDEQAAALVINEGAVVSTRTRPTP